MHRRNYFQLQRVYLQNSVLPSRKVFFFLAQCIPLQKYVFTLKQTFYFQKSVFTVRPQTSLHPPIH